MTPPTIISIPCGLTRTQRVIELANHVHQLDKNIQIQAYDAVQGLQWNGGRVILNSKMSHLSLAKHEQLYDVTVENMHVAVDRVRRLNDHGIGFNLTLNNVLENLDVDDEDGNDILRRLENSQNSVTLATRALTHHVKQHYPKFKMTGSICFAFGTQEEYARACEIYDVVVMMPIFAYLPEVLSSLPADKLSFILNDGCSLYCQRKEHYQAMSRCSLAGMTTEAEQSRSKTVSCNYRRFPDYRKKLPVGITEEHCRRVTRIASEHFEAMGDLNALPGGEPFNISRQARADLLGRGVRHFKLQGREMNEANFERKVVEVLEAFISREL